MKSKGIKDSTEVSSAVSTIAYEIENELYEGKNLSTIRDSLKDLKDNKQFPPNLQLIDAFYDQTLSSSGCAFLDTNTGEVIVGFAGTNWDNGIWEGLKDGFADLAIGITGINPNSKIYMARTNEFMRKLEANGYNVSTVTGHSLGGCLAVLVALNYNIPQAVTYNAAPLYGNPLFVSDTIKDLYKKYQGRVIQFVSQDDFLNNYSDGFNAFYIGEKYILYNEKGHAITGFLEDSEQSYVQKIMLMEKGYLEGKTGFILDFDKDGNPDLALTSEQLAPKNLLGDLQSTGGIGEKLQLSPESLENLSLNLSVMVVNDLGWIRQAIQQCADKNDTIKSHLETRHDTLCEDIVSELKSSSLDTLLSGVNESFGKLEGKTDVLEDLSSFNSYTVTRKFDEWGKSAGRKWFADGVEWDNQGFIDAVTKLKEASSVLLHNVTTNGELSYYDQQGSGGKQIYTYDTLSKIGEAFVQVTNGLEPKIKKVFTGTGLREGKSDGISEALTEVFQVEEQNIGELEKGTGNLIQIAHGVAQNFKEMDAWLSNNIQQGTMRGTPSMQVVPESYQAYLEESSIMDDVKDVLEAFDQQVEERSMQLSEQLSADYGDLLGRFHTKCSSIIEYIQNFETSVQELNDWMGKSITSTYETVQHIRKIDEKELNGKIYTTTSYEKKTELHTDSHGTLGSSFPADVVEDIETAETEILPLLEVFHETLSLSEVFGSRIYDIQNYLKSVIEHGVYKSMELECIVIAQNGIGQILEKIMTELNSLRSQIESDSHGKSLLALLDQISSLCTLMGYFGKVIEDCFGVKVSNEKPTAQPRK